MLRKRADDGYSQMFSQKRPVYGRDVGQRRRLSTNGEIALVMDGGAHGSRSVVPLTIKTFELEFFEYERAFVHGTRHEPT